MAPPGEADPFIVVEDVYFPADHYRLEGELAYPEGANPVGAAVVAGPHPLLGGDLHNNVARGLGDGLAARGLITLRFNYRGVGRSEGPPVDVAAHLARFWATSHAPDEADLWQDVQGAADFVRQAAGPDLPLALIGYSFGCALLPHVRPGRRPHALVLIAPTVGKHDYRLFLSPRVPTLVVASEDDFATDIGLLRDWFGRLSGPKELVLQRLDNHFFRGHEGWLAEQVLAFLRRVWR
jgi:alpha/beta superfamily hydrolase